MNRVTEVSLRVFGVVTAGFCIVLGSAFVVTFFFIGQAAGFAESDYTLKFAALVLYVLCTMVLAVWVALRPSVLRGVLLAGLVTPYLIFSVLTA